ncbi:MAG: hemolysin family protein [Candidatus Thorarchaeota archaeon]
MVAEFYSVSELFIRILLIIMLIALNGFFVAAEFSLVSIRPSRVEELISNGNKRAKTVKRVIMNQDDIISATQLGITLASLALGIIGEQTIENFLMRFNLDSIFQFALSSTIAFILLTYMHVVLGELVPKSIALEKAVTTALWIAWPMEKFEKISKPVIWVFNLTARGVLDIFHIEPAIGHRHIHSEDELKLLITQSEAAGLLDTQESDILQRTFDLPDTLIREIMTPRVDLVSISVDEPFNNIVRIVNESGHSRIPVYEENKDNIVGLLYAKDLLKYFVHHLSEDDGNNHIPAPDIRDILRIPDFVPETMLAHNLLAQFQTSKRQVAVVTNEFGGIEGIVSLEDILELLVGDIQDEYDIEPPEIIQIEKGSSEVSAQTSIEDFNEYFDTEFESDQSVTIGGYLVEKIGRLPEENETFQIEDIVFKIEKKNGFRIETLVVNKKEKLDKIETQNGIELSKMDELNNNSDNHNS